MTISHMPPATGPVQVSGNTLTIRELTVSHAEAASIARSHLAESGPEGVADLIRRAIPIGMIALTMGSAAVDTGVISRTLDDFADRLDAKSQAAVQGLEATLSRLQAGETEVARTATDVLTRLPAQVEAALGGQAGNVRAAVAEATRAAQAAGLQELRAALAQHSDAVKGALSLDRDGPVQQLRRDMLHELAGTRRELAEQVSTVRALLQASQAHQTAAAKNSRAVGAEWEAQAMAIANEVITAAGDRFEATGSQPARLGGSTRRTGDAIATLSRAVTGPGRTVRIAVEAKRRTARPMSASELQTAIAACRQARDAAAGLVLVPTTAEVPGGGHFARVDDLAFVAACEDPSNVSLIYLILRELTTLVTVQHDGNEIDLAKAEAQINYCLNLLTEFDEVARLANAAEKNLHAIRNTGGAVKAKMQAALNGTLQALSG